MQQFFYKLLYTCIYGAYGVVFPYIPIFFDTLYMTKSQIGILSMIPNVCSFFVAPIFGLVADKFNAHCELMMVALLVSTGTTYLMLYVTTFFNMFWVVLTASIFRAPVGPQVDSMVISSLEDKSSYGNYRLWGAVGYGTMVFIGGLMTDGINHIDEGTSRKEIRNNFLAVFALYAVITLIGGCTILLLVYTQTIKTQEQKIQALLSSGSRLRDEEMSSSKSTVSSRSEDDDGMVEIELSTIHKDSERGSGLIKEEVAEGNIVGSILTLFNQNPSIYVFCAIVLLSGVGSGVIDTFLFLRLKQLGATGLCMGISRFITCAAEVPMFQVAGPLQSRFGTWPMLAVTQLAFVVRFTYYANLSNPWTVLPCEMLHGLTYATTWNVSCTYASVIAPPGTSSTVQALLEGLHWGIGSGLGAIIGGLLYDYYGAVRLFQISGALSFASMLLAMGACVYCSNSIGSSINKPSTGTDTDTDTNTDTDTDTDSSVGAERGEPRLPRRQKGMYSNVPLGTEDDDL